MSELDEITEGKNTKELDFQINKMGNRPGDAICAYIIDKIERNGGKVIIKKHTTS